MRLAPVALRYWNDNERLRDVGRHQSYTTHGADETVTDGGRQSASDRITIMSSVTGIASGRRHDPGIVTRTIRDERHSGSAASHPMIAVIVLSRGPETVRRTVGPGH